MQLRMQTKEGINSTKEQHFMKLKEEADRLKEEKR